VSHAQGDGGDLETSTAKDSKAEDCGVHHDLPEQKPISQRITNHWHTAE
jgi:hypothetical protein